MSSAYEENLWRVETKSDGKIIETEYVGDSAFSYHMSSTLENLSVKYRKLYPTKYVKCNGHKKDDLYTFNNEVKVYGILAEKKSLIAPLLIASGTELSCKIYKNNEFNTDYSYSYLILEQFGVGDVFTEIIKGQMSELCEDAEGTSLSFLNDPVWEYQHTC